MRCLQNVLLTPDHSVGVRHVGGPIHIARQQIDSAVLVRRAVFPDQVYRRRRILSASAVSHNVPI